MPFYDKGDIHIHYEEAGSGFPLLVIPGGGLNSTVAGLATHPFNPFDEFQGEFRVIAADLRNAKGGQSAGPLDVDRPWDAYTDDQLGLMDHLGIREFMVLGFCIGGPFIWNLLQRAGDRVVAAVPAAQRLPPGDARPLLHQQHAGLGLELCARRPDITMAMVETFLTNMYGGARADFVYTVSRDFVRQCQTPILVLPDDVPAHPYAVAMETVHLAPNAQVSLYPWKDAGQDPLAVRRIRTFLRPHQPVTVAYWHLWRRRAAPPCPPWGRTRRHPASQLAAMYPRFLQPESLEQHVQVGPARVASLVEGEGRSVLSTTARPRAALQKVTADASWVSGQSISTGA